MFVLVRFVLCLYLSFAFVFVSVLCLWLPLFAFVVPFLCWFCVLCLCFVCLFVLCKCACVCARQGQECGSPVISDWRSCASRSHWFGAIPLCRRQCDIVCGKRCQYSQHLFSSNEHLHRLRSGGKRIVSWLLKVHELVLGDSERNNS